MKISLPSLFAVSGIFFAPISELRAIVLNNEVKNGGVVNDGNGDLYDEFGFFSVNGLTYDGTISGVDPVYTALPQQLGGILVTGQVTGFQPLGLDEGDTDFLIVRWWFTLTNTSSAAASANIQFFGGVGSDDNTILTASSGSRRNWIVTADDLDQDVPNDPVVGHVFSSPDGLVAPEVLVLGELDGTIAANLDIVIPRGTTVSLAFFATARNITGSNNGESLTVDVLSDLNNVLLDKSGNVKPAFLSGGLAQANTVINHSLADGHTRITGIRTKVRGNGDVNVTGRATSAFGIGQVNYFVGNLVGKAKGKERWSFRPRRGGRLTVQATDLLGGTSTEVRVRVPEKGPSRTRYPRAIQ